MGTFIYQGLQKRAVPLRPKVFLVGTHKDQLSTKTVSSHIAKVDHQLLEAIKLTSHYKDLVEFASPSQLIFTVNNFSEDDSDFKNIRSVVEHVIRRDEFQMTSPAHWLIFSLALRNLKDHVISYGHCLEIARKCGLTTSEFDEALHFIHSKMGLIRYFPYEDVKDLVIIHPQFLFDKVTELIVDTFTFEKTSKQSMDEFKEKGIFSLSLFENVSSKTNSFIQPFQFVKLLERLRIAAPFLMDGSRMYFFPCVLAHSAKEGKVHRLLFSSTRRIPRLIVTFKCGYCPKGLAGALIKYLMANEMKSCNSWKLLHNRVFRNQVSFKVGPHDTVVLKILSTHLKITFIPKKFRDRSKTYPVDKVCTEVREAVEAGIRQVTSDINYVNAQHSITFHCGCKRKHPGVLVFSASGTPYCLLCSRTDKQFVLPAGHEIWNISDATVCKLGTSPIHQQSKLVIKSESGISPATKQTVLVPTRLAEDHHAVLFKQLQRYAAKWKEIGISLGFFPGELNNIQAKALLLENSPTSWLSELLAQWLQWAPGDSRGSNKFATLEELKSALRKTGLGATAHDLGI